MGRRSLLFVVGLIMATHGGSATTYRIENLGTLGGDKSEAYDINDNDWVTGRSYLSDVDGGFERAFLWTNGVMVDLGFSVVDPYTTSNSWGRGINIHGDTCGASGSAPFMYSKPYGQPMVRIVGVRSRRSYDINDNGEIVGYVYGSSSPRLKGAYYADALYWYLNGPNNEQAITYGINSGGKASGKVVGRAETGGAGVYEACYWEFNVDSNAWLHTSLGTEAIAWEVNDAGVIVGHDEEPTSHALKWVDSGSGYSITTQATLSGSSAAYYINNAGQVVGFSTTAGGDPHAVLWDADGAIHDLNDMIRAGTGWELMSAQAINARGHIVGYGRIGGQTNAFLMHIPHGLYELIDLGTLGGDMSEAYDVNDNDWVCGRSTLSAGEGGDARGFIWQSGVLTDLGPLPGYSTSNSWAQGINVHGDTCGYATITHYTFSKPYGQAMVRIAGSRGRRAYDINDNGEIAGYSVLTTPPAYRGFYYASGSYTFLYGGASDILAQANGINAGGKAGGKVVGRSYTGSGGTAWEACCWEFNTDSNAWLYANLGTEGSAWEINDSDVIVGEDTVNARAVKWADSGSGYAATTLATLGGDSVAYDINNTGLIVGYSTTPNSDQHAVIWESDEVIYDLNELLYGVSGWTLTDARAINAKGHIAGYGIDPNGDTRAFLLIHKRPSGSLFIVQ